MISQHRQKGHKNVENTNMVRGCLRHSLRGCAFGGGRHVLSFVLLDVDFFGGMMTPYAKCASSQKWLSL